MDTMLASGEPSSTKRQSGEEAAATLNKPQARRFVIEWRQPEKEGGRLADYNDAGCGCGGGPWNN
jgi:hypothetical protein